ncbi:tubulin-like doman-containing protein [Dactylosporangium sp. NPDC000521]|uniref:tubulin-like doman-containing protein n=1 Tax=Dactylosporangium sp. NPDC000521 TaxID=3363975 RepID=UPI00368B79FE
MRPTLVVGLGGTGSWAVAHLKRRLLTEQRWRELATPGAPVRERFEGPVLLRAVDVDRTDRPLVGRTQLETDVEDLFLSAQVAPVIDQLRDDAAGAADMYTTIVPWFGRHDAQQVRSDDAMSFMTTGAGQVRAFGRLALYTDFQSARAFSRPLQAAFDELSSGSDGAAFNVHVVSSIAGGTGAGLLIDVLAWLQRERQRRDATAAFRTSVFCVLPEAFKDRLEEHQLAAADANGYAVLRELHRLVMAEQPVDFVWREQERHRLTRSPAQHVYLIDGERLGARSTGAAAVEAPCPIAVADAIYTHVLPAAEGDLSAYLTNVQSYVAGRDDVYSTFGVFTVELAWEPLIRQFALTAAGQVLDRQRRYDETAVTALVRRFGAGVLVLSGQAVTPPALLLRIDEAERELVPNLSWLANDGPATPPPLPRLLEEFADNDGFRGAELTAAIEERLVAFWGPRFAAFNPAAPTFHAAMTEAAAAVERRWVRDVQLLLSHAMSGTGSGPDAGLGAVRALAMHLEHYRQRLGRDVVRPPVDTMFGAMEAARTLLDRPFRRRHHRQQYLDAIQSWLQAEVQEEIDKWAGRLVERLLAVVEAMRQETLRWQTVLEDTAAHLRADSQEIAEERERAERLPLRRIVPSVTDAAVERRLYDEIVGEPGDDRLPSRLAGVGAGLRFHAVPGNPVALTLEGPLAGSGTPARQLVAALLRQTTPVFDQLRTMSVFDMLERLGAGAGAVAHLLVDGGAPLAGYDVAQHHQHLRRRDQDDELQELRYVVAAWPAAEHPGGALATELRQALARQRIQVEDAHSPGEPRPTSDKIVQFCARHGLVLPAFTGVSKTRPAYDRRRGGPLSPHVLPEEKNAARIESTAADLVGQGLLRGGIAEIHPADLPLCRDPGLLRATAVALACDVLRPEPDHQGRVARWWLRDGYTEDLFHDAPDLRQGLIEIADGERQVDRARFQTLRRAAEDMIRHGEGVKRARQHFLQPPPVWFHAGLWQLLLVAVHLPDQGG